ncbi:hypothetical protein DPM19_29350 [Actinomadura craniellae]|uniref:Uncharacterized protein n=1 Tax=Actinomadura craniellae TaxID=2231787 RepID=A0A365GY11_9ACTN|nr:DUF4132 domain-containing protein [Actinomadura craniellae]RAY11719.1 hypothetical protein DPM19_29350 [Actinomadura craniellae]
MSKDSLGTLILDAARRLVPDGDDPARSLAARERAFRRRLDGEIRSLLAAIDEDGPGLDPAGWEAVAASDYADFARLALAAAADRAAAIQSGEIPYQPENAFSAKEVPVLGRAARTALVRDDPWLPELLGRLLPAIAVAPTPARTLPSQALLFELARAVQDFPTVEAVTALREVRGVIRHRGVPKMLDRNIKRIDAALALRPETAFRLPDLGFAPDGTLTRTLGAHRARVDENGLSWQGPGGKRLRGVPTAVRRDHPDELKQVRALVKQVRAHHTTLLRALEAGFAEEIVHSYGRWRDELAGHPLGRPLIEQLIWEVETEPGQWRAGLPADGGRALHDPAGTALPAVDDDATVRLWHPIRSEPEEIRAWRDLLVERGLRQPFKQAFREIYLLTPAELVTARYSNRFAGHIVHYRRMYALFKERRWQSGLLGPWDGGDGGEAVRELGRRRWRARFRHDYVEYTDAGELASTDQVRFDHRPPGRLWREVPLAEVPPVVFSEAMRDVDLFVGVTSIAADPDWQDRGDDPYFDYRRRAGFGELDATAEIRAEALARLLPRTRLAGRAELAGRFLRVTGTLRTYKIHLGSGNILMEPDDAYLCIVPARAEPGERVFLPFEDTRLALILSKAFLLADDAEITDPSILHQIRRSTR